MIFACGMHSFQAILNMVVVRMYLVVSERMSVCGIGLDSMSFACIMKACACTGCIDTRIWTYEEITRNYICMSVCVK